ncbi:MAG: hypothetical protein IPO18_06865 [bacterium]|jgi:hypothetical protein|nr:hypothetical protein [bacterium]
MAGQQLVHLGEQIGVVTAGLTHEFAALAGRQDQGAGEDFASGVEATVIDGRTLISIGMLTSACNAGLEAGVKRGRMMGSLKNLPAWEQFCNPSRPHGAHWGEAPHEAQQVPLVVSNQLVSVG